MRCDHDGVDTTLGMTGRRRYLYQAASPPPSRTGVAGRFDAIAEPGQAPPSPTTTMDALRKMEVATLRERVVRAQYEVDSRAVAGAILARLLAERSASGDSAP